MYQFTLDDIDVAPTPRPFIPSGKTFHYPDKNTGKGGIQLRGYQHAANDSVREQFANGVKSTLVEMATGTGKSLCLADLSKEYANQGKGVLSLAHREELIEQNIDAVEELGMIALKEKASENALGKFRRVSNIVVASVQTMRGKRLERWDPNDFSLILCDEAHHFRAQSFRDILEYFPNAQIAGYTATPDRADGRALGNVFQTKAFTYSIWDALHDTTGPWLVPPIVRPLYLDTPIDLRNLKFRAGDYRAEELEQVIQENLGRCVNAIRKTGVLEDRATIAFTPDVESARDLAAALRDVGITAESISCYDSDRAEILQRFRNREFQVLCNAMLLTEGTNLPFVSCILLLRPTKSRSLYVQMVGRGLRLCPAIGKEDCFIIDVPFLAEKHALVKPIELFFDGEDMDEKRVTRVADIAQAMIDSGKESNLDDAWQKAKEEEEFERIAREMERRAREEAQRIKIAKRDVKATAGRYDPLATYSDGSGYEYAPPPEQRTKKPPTEKMIGFLRGQGVRHPENMSFEQASGYITKLKRDMNNGLCSPSQVNYLCVLGMARKDAQGLSFAAAQAEIDRLIRTK